MASNVVSDNFETGTGGVPQLGGTGATTCKAWCRFDGSIIYDSYNVSSVTDNATGEFTVNFTANMSNANYSFSACSKGNNRASLTYSYASDASKCSVRVTQSDDTKNDEMASVQIFSN
jgi:hypothetical protein